MIGERFGRLVIVGLANVDSTGHRWVIVLCDCGETKKINAQNLRRGFTRSCGCLRREATAARQKARRDPEKYTGTYSTWRAMIARCADKSDPDYGGRGISVCGRWRLYQNFREDMGPRPLHHAIDRIDNDGNYEPSNCRWADPETQSRNRPDYVRLDPIKARAIRESTETPLVLSKRYGVARVTIYAVRSGRIWKTA